MKKLFYTFFLLVGVELYSNEEIDTKEINVTIPIVKKLQIIEKKDKKVISATRGDIKVIEASENIRYLSQKIVKEYLFFFRYQDNLTIKRELEQSLEKLNDNLRVIAMTTKDIDTKDILEFLAYSKDQIEQIFNEKVNEERAALMLDYSETLLEGANSIAQAHKYDFSDEEKMLMLTKEVEYLMQRVTKYYMALYTGFGDSTNRKQMQESIRDMDENIAQINNYNYPLDFQKTQKKINDSWRASKNFFLQFETLFIPKLMFMSVDYMEDLVSQIALHHSKNQ